MEKRGIRRYNINEFNCREIDFICALLNKIRKEMSIEVRLGEMCNGV